MLVFIDDSGDPGFKMDKGSSTHSVIACIIFDDNHDAEETSDAIRQFRQSLNWHGGSEFKFNKLKKRLRLDFLVEVKRCQA